MNGVIMQKNKFDSVIFLGGQIGYIKTTKGILAFSVVTFCASAKGQHAISGLASQQRRQGWVAARAGKFPPKKSNIQCNYKKYILFHLSSPLNKLPEMA